MMMMMCDRIGDRHRGCGMEWNGMEETKYESALTQVQMIHWLPYNFAIKFTCLSIFAASTDLHILILV